MDPNNAPQYGATQSGYQQSAPQGYPAQPQTAGYPQNIQPSPQQATIAPNIGANNIDPTQPARPVVAPPSVQSQQGPTPQAYGGPVVQQPQQGARYIPNRAGGYPEEETQSHGTGKDTQNVNSTQKMLQFAEIRDGLVIMEDGSFRSVVMAQSINFDLMSQGEREAVEYAYQSFLNSLHFDIQIQIKSRRVDLRGYISKLEGLRNQQDNMLLSYLMEDYIGYISYISQESNIMDKQFFIVIPYYSPARAGDIAEKSKGALGGLFGKGGNNETIHITERDLAEAKAELKNRTSSVINGLNQMGVRGIALDTEELAELFYISYNPDTGVRQQIDNYQDLTTASVEKGYGENPRSTGGLGL